MYPYEYDFSPGDENDTSEGDFIDNEDDLTPELLQYLNDKLLKSSNNDQPTANQLQEDSLLILPRIQKEMNFSERKISEFIIKFKKAMKLEKEEYVIPVKQVRKIGNVQRCTNCSRRILTFTDHALEFKIALYHFLFGRRFDKIYLKKLHNSICDSINLPKMSRAEYRSIKLYFAHFWNRGFEVIREAHKYLEEHPDFANEIKSTFDKSKDQD